MLFLLYEKKITMNNNIKEYAKNYKIVIVYGLGIYGRRCYFDVVDLRKRNVRIFLAVTQLNTNQKFHEEEVYNLNSLIQYKKEALVIISVGDKYRNEMEAYARNLGFLNVYSPIIKLNDIDYIKTNPDIHMKREIMDWYEVYTGKSMDLDHPRTFNEKIQWLKLYDSTPIKGELSDKYLVRDYVRNVIGEQYLVPLYGVWDSFEEINFSQLPESFALKCTHGSGTNAIICSKEEMDYSALKERFRNWMEINYAYACGFEMHYQYITPRIIAEKYLKTSNGSDLRDYKVHVFQGQVKLIQVDIDRMHYHRRNLYTREWEYVPCAILYPTAPEVWIEQPECLDELISISELLAKGFIYVRVDFYILNGHIYFGEMTFTHGSGVEAFTPETFNMEMGSWIQLPVKEGK